MRLFYQFAVGIVLGWSLPSASAGPGSANRSFDVSPAIKSDSQMVIGGDDPSAKGVLPQNMARVSGIASLEDLYGHYLKIDTIEDLTDPNNFFFPFAARLTIKNPSLTVSGAGFVELTSLIPTDKTKFSFQPIPAGGSIVVDITGNGNLPVDCSSGDIGTCTNTFFATVFEQTASGVVAEDSRFIFEVVNNQPPTGGVPTGARSGAPVAGFQPPPILTNLTIVGPAEVSANSAADFAVLAELSNGSSNQLVSATWSSSPFPISSLGRLTTGDVASDTPVTITASLSLGPITKTVSRQVTVVSPSPPKKNLGQPRFLANGDFQFIVSGLPGRRYMVQKSFDLKGWTDWTTVTLDQTAELVLTDPLAQSRQLFYRGLLLP
jgi:hypothetical protein